MECAPNSAEEAQEIEPAHALAERGWAGQSEIQPPLIDLDYVAYLREQLLIARASPTENLRGEVNRLRGEVADLHARVEQLEQLMLEGVPMSVDTASDWLDANMTRLLERYAGQFVAVDRDKGGVVAAADDLDALRDNVREQGMNGKVLITTVPSQ